MCHKVSIYRCLNSFNRQLSPNWMPQYERTELERYFRFELIPLKQGVYIPFFSSVAPKTNIYVKAFGRLTSQ